MITERKIEKIFVERRVIKTDQTKRILDKLSGIPVEVIEDQEIIKREIRLSADPVGKGKRILLLTEQKSFIRPCPCTPGCVGCGYWTIDLDTNCPLDCSYCILQGYLEEQPLTVAVNRGDLKKELDLFFAQKKMKVLRIGTGELGDSLALDDLTENSIFLAELFRNFPDYYLELKTKTARIDLLLEMKPASNIILSWSLNPEKIVHSEEKGAASLSQRLNAAARAVNHSFRVAFHFDPVIHYPGWLEDYREVIEMIFKMIPAEAITWISLGTLRFPAELLNVARRRFPESTIYEHEFIRSWEGKFRYPRPLRLKIYGELSKIFQHFKVQDKLYLCMESKDVWSNFLEKNKRGRLVSASPFSWLS